MFKSNELKVLLTDSTEVLFGALELGDVLQGQGSGNRVVAITQTYDAECTMHAINGRHGIGAAVPIATTTGWKAVSPGLAMVRYPYLDITQLMQGDDLICPQGEIEAVTSIEQVADGDEDIKYEISLDGDHTFFVNGMLVHNKGGSSAPSTTTTVQKNEPPAYLQPYLTDIANQAQSAYNQVPQGGFQGNLVAPVDPRQTEALELQENIARGLGGFGDTTNQIANQQAQRVLSGDILAPISERFNPQSYDTSSVLAAALDPVQERLTEQIIPGIQSQAIQSGAYGGTRQDVVTGQALQDFSREANNIAAGLSYQDFARTEDQRLQDLLSVREFAPELEKLNQAAALTSPELANQGLQQNLTQSQLLGQVGQTDRLFGQDAIDEAYQRYILDTQTPFAGLDQYAGLVNGVTTGGTSTLTGPRSAAASSGGGALGGAIGGGLAGYGLASSIDFLNPYTAPLAIGGALLGGLFS